MSTTRTTVATTPALSFYLPVLARLLMCSLFIWVPLLGEFARGGWNERLGETGEFSQLDARTRHRTISMSFKTDSKFQ
jgi:hypothetical protein